ncbi:MAG TPA: FG-GAP-like repeat-containing protein [Hyalangium sp.]|nr:FG-GAP-like repeat-containing protein [Hyalangium sp.]
MKKMDWKSMGRSVSTVAAALLMSATLPAGQVWAADLDRDGYDDLVVGAPGEAPGVDPSSGAAFLFRGGAGGMTVAQALDQSGLTGNGLGDDFGRAIATGDFDGDGYADLAVGIPGKDFGSTPDVGMVLVFKGSAQGLVGQQMLDQALNTNDDGDLFGTSLAVGDFNGDGYDDLVVGAPGESIGVGSPGPRTGVVFHFQGSPDGLVYVRYLSQEPLDLAEGEDDFGRTLVAGDLDRDGYDDLVVGAPGEDLGRGPSGLLFVFRGSPEGLSASYALDQSPSTNDSGDRFGDSLALGDFNGDGYLDLAVGAPGEAVGSGSPGPRSGVAFYFRGSPNGLSYVRYLSQGSMGGDEGGDEFGRALAAGDFDGDGKDDLVVGAPGEAIGNGARSGAAFLFRGTTNGPASVRYLSQSGLAANGQGDRFGAALVTGDYNGDGYADLAVGAPGKTSLAGTRSGGVFIFRGQVKNLLVAHQWLDQGGAGLDEAGDSFGAGLSR